MGRFNYLLIVCISNTAESAETEVRTPPSIDYFDLTEDKTSECVIYRLCS